MNRRSPALRRRRKPSFVTRLRIFWVFIAVGVSALAYGAYVVVTLPQLRVHGVRVSIAGDAVSRHDVLAAAHVDRRINLWLLDTAAIARRIEALPYVDRADVRRTPAADLRIDVSLREPAACVRRGARIVTIDRQQRILQNDCARPDAVAIDLRDGTLGRPGSTLNSATLGALLADERALRAARVGVQSIGNDDFGGLVAVETSGIRLLFGSDSDLADKARLVAPVMAATESGRPVRAIDLRAPATPTVEFR